MRLGIKNKCDRLFNRNIITVGMEELTRVLHFIVLGSPFTYKRDLIESNTQAYSSKRKNTLVKVL